MISSDIDLKRPSPSQLVCMSIWNKYLCGLFGDDKSKVEKKGDFQCPLCKERVKAGELRVHAKDDGQFKD